MAVAGHAHDTIALLPRLGYAARGIVYLIVGGLAVAAATGSGGRVTDTKGALRTILEQPLGDVLLALVAAGLVLFALWRVVQAVIDTDGHGSDGKGLVIRAGLIVSALLHLALAFFAFSLIFGWGQGGGESGADGWTAKLMRQPFGRWLVVLVGLAVVGAGIAQIVKGWRAEFEEHCDAPPDVMRWASPVSRFGLIARGVVFLIIGGFLGLAAMNYDPEQARGLAGALYAVQGQPYGWILLAVVALGLVGFAIYCFIESAYRRVSVQQVRPLSRHFSGR